MGRTITTVSLSAEDKELLAILQERYGVEGTSQTIRLALKLAVAMPAPAQVFGQSPDVFVIPKTDETGFVKAVGTGLQRPVVSFTRQKMVFENGDEK